jgi:GNAT superfamily N-acetyltransferase
MQSTKQRRGSSLILTILSESNEVLSILQSVYTPEKTFIITNLFTHEEHRNRGFGTRLLHRAIWEARRNKMLRIELDDCTDRGSTFYIQHGFQYVEPGFPEMIMCLV